MEIDRQRAHKNNADSPLMALPAIYRLLYSAGLRMGEALSIRNKDVNLQDGTILIHATKREAERIIALHDTMKDVLRDYIECRNRMPLSGLTNPEHHLFVKLDGTPVTDKAVYANFRSLLRKCGIQYGGRSRGPGLHLHLNGSRSAAGRGLFHSHLVRAGGRPAAAAAAAA